MGFRQWLEQVDEDMLTPRHPSSWARSTLGLAWAICMTGAMTGLVLVWVAPPLGVTVFVFSVGAAIYTWWRRTFVQDSSP